MWSNRITCSCLWLTVVWDDFCYPSHISLGIGLLTVDSLVVTVIMNWHYCSLDKPIHAQSLSTDAKGFGYWFSCCTLIGHTICNPCNLLHSQSLMPTVTITSFPLLPFNYTSVCLLLLTDNLKPVEEAWPPNSNPFQLVCAVWNSD